MALFGVVLVDKQATDFEAVDSALQVVISHEFQRVSGFRSLN